MKFVLFCYLVLPICFYIVNAALHWELLALNEGSRLISMQICLPVTAFCVFWLSVRWIKPTGRWRMGGACAGALGLVHWFPVYLSIGALLLWDSPGKGEGVLSAETILPFFINLLFPIVTFSGSFYDGSALALCLSIVILLLMGRACATSSTNTTSPRIGSGL